ncbi:MAG: class I SAM-dependent methyltransferase [Janthinobacterium lividum]
MKAESLAQPYVLGHSEHEVERLLLQSACIEKITRRLFNEAGLREGMRVLDVGCGLGDVSMLASQFVGPHGSVVGVDRDATAVMTSQARSNDAGLRIAFHQADEATLEDPEPFDFVIGRYVLLHQADPAEFIRRVAARVRPGGVVALHEVVCRYAPPSVPAVPLWDETAEQIASAFRSALNHSEAGSSLFRYFTEAGLYPPSLFCEVPIGSGPDPLFYEWAAMTLKSVRPDSKSLSGSDAKMSGVHYLASQLRADVVAARSQVQFAQQHCGWARV